MTRCHLETMPPCHVQVKTPNFFSASKPQNKKDLVGFCDTSGNCNTDWILFFVSFGGPWQHEGKIVNFVSSFLAKLGDFGWESELLSGDADLVEQDLIPGQSAASVLQSVTVLQCVAEYYSVTVCYRVLQPECCQCYTDSYPPDYFYPENGKFKIWEHCCLQTGTNHHFKQFLQNINVVDLAKTALNIRKGQNVINFGSQNFSIFILYC